jgi:hypothetical protein
VSPVPWRSTGFGAVAGIPTRTPSDRERSCTSDAYRRHRPSSGPARSSFGCVAPWSAVADRLDVLARAAVSEPVPTAVRLDARDFRGMELEPTLRKTAEKRAELVFYSWSSPASIRGPSAFQADALPTELLDRRRAAAVLSHSGGAAVPTGLEPATSGLTGRRELQTSPRDLVVVMCTPNGIRTRAATLKGWCPRPLDDGGHRLQLRALEH